MAPAPPRALRGASLLIAKGLNVVFVSRQLGHSRAQITLRASAHLFQEANQAPRAREALEAGYAALAGTRRAEP